MTNYAFIFTYLYTYTYTLMHICIPMSKPISITIALSSIQHSLYLIYLPLPSLIKQTREKREGGEGGGVLQSQFCVLLAPPLRLYYHCYQVLLGLAIPTPTSICL
ncbi:hypothetical protein EON63_09970 [archaeon]|nr:MAG: hypothetical protein EON63_09970 [archaeon]